MTFGILEGVGNSLFHYSNTNWAESMSGDVEDAELSLAAAPPPSMQGWFTSGSLGWQRRQCTSELPVGDERRSTLYAGVIMHCILLYMLSCKN